MRDRQIHAEFAHAAERKLAAEILRPIKRAIPASLNDCCAAVRQPKSGVLVAVIADKLEIFAVSNKGYWRRIAKLKCARKRYDPATATAAPLSS